MEGVGGLREVGVSVGGGGGRRGGVRRLGSERGWLWWLRCRWTIRSQSGSRGGRHRPVMQPASSHRLLPAHDPATSAVVFSVGRRYLMRGIACQIKARVKPPLIQEDRFHYRLFSREPHDNDCIERRNSIFTISSLRRELSPTRTLKWPGRNRVQITCNTSNTSHVQPAVCHVV